MARRTLLTRLPISLGIICLVSFPAFSAEHHHSEKARQIVAMVERAAALVESKGTAAFPELKKKGSTWYNGTTYLFVDDMNGTVLVNPPSPEIEGKNLIDMKDARGNYILREFILVARTEGSGWVDYWWPEPGGDKPFKKMSYLRRVTMPDGRMVIVGAGIYVEGN